MTDAETYPRLVRKAETRERNTPAPSIHTAAGADAHSVLDADSRRPSLSRRNSHRSQATAAASSTTTIQERTRTRPRALTPRPASPLAAPPFPPIPPAAPPAKLRKARSRASYKQLPAEVRSVHSSKSSPSPSPGGSSGRDGEPGKEVGKRRERKRDDSFNSYSVLSSPGPGPGPVVATERSLMEWLAAVAEKPVIILRRPARAVGRWVRCIVLKGRNRGRAKAQAKLTYDLEEEDECK